MTKNQSKVKYSQEQLAVLESEGKNIIVSASAGSGKTTVMIEKLIRHITQNNISVKELLVLTYTKAAAEEMKQKLVKALYEVAEQDEKYLSQIDDVALADISTIHSFFQKLIKKNFMMLSLNPSFKVIEEQESETLKKEALAQSLEVLSEANPKKIERLLDYYAQSRTDKTIKEILEKINVFLQAVENQDEWCKTKAFRLFEENFNQNYALFVLNENICETAEYYISQFVKVSKKGADLGLEKLVAYCSNIIAQLMQINLPREEIIYFDAYLKGKHKKLKIEDTTFFKNYKLFTNIDFGKMPTIDGFEELKQEIEKTKKELKDKSDKWKKKQYTEEHVRKSLKEIKETILILLELNSLYENTYSSIKKDKNCLDFNDLEKYALKLLENKEVCQAIKEEYAYIFIDEYQDANRVQEKILSLISRDNNRFMVGDVKQSIYGFRQAEPDIFLGKEKDFENDENSEALKLKSNFRSHSAILEFVNKVFSVIMTNNTAKINYAKDALLDPQAKYVDTDNGFSNVEILLIKPKDKEKKEPEEVYSVLAAMKNHQDESVHARIEAKLVAEQISQLIGKKIYDPKLQAERGIEFKDICLLLNSRGAYLEQFSTVLNEYNIPLYANTSTPLYKDEDVAMLINLLRLTINIADDVALSSVLHSVFAGLSYDEITMLKFAFTYDKLHKNITALLKLSKVFDLSVPSKDRLQSTVQQDGPEELLYCAEFFQKVDLGKLNILAEKLRKFNERLQNFMFNVKYKGLFIALSQILAETDFYSYLYNKSDGLEKVEKVKKFVEDFCYNGYNQNLAGFLKFVDESGDIIKAPNTASGDNCVLVTTIHSSKGLEYPIVFLLNSGNSFEGRSSDSNIQLNSEFGIALKSYDESTRTKRTSVVFDAMQRINKSNMLAEKLRLFYVALTRAKNHLFIVGTAKNSFKKITSDFQTKHIKSFLGFIIGSFQQEEIDIINQGIDIKKEEYSVKIFHEDDLEKSGEIENNIQFGKTNQIYVECLKNYFSLKLPQKQDISLKNSVTSLNQENLSLTSQNTNPKNFSLSEHQPKQMAEIGTKVHSLMEELSFKKDIELNDVERIAKELKIENDINIEKIFESLKLLEKFKPETILKEQLFMMYVPHKELVKNGSNEKILVQGVIDLILLGKQNILIDFKLTKSSDAKIKERYKTQVKLYKKACEDALGVRINKTFLLNLNTAKLIDMMT